MPCRWPSGAVRKPRACITHSDHEFAQYTSWAFGTRLWAASLLGSMGSIGDAYDNSMAESFFHTLQLELLDEHHWDTHRDLALAVFVAAVRGDVHHPQPVGAQRSNLHHPAARGYRQVRALGDEGVGHSGRTFSRAKYAAACRRISISNSTTRSLRRSSTTSARLRW
jgi:hypothetical protein